MLEEKISLCWLKSVFFAVLFLTACSDNNSGAAANKAPTLAVVGSNTVIERESVSITAQAEDADGSIASYLWTVVSGGNVTLTGDDSAEVTFQAIDVNVDTEVELEVVVTDDKGATTSANHTLLFYVYLMN